jgi:hypothetical protein
VLVSRTSQPLTQHKEKPDYKWSPVFSGSVAVHASNVSFSREIDGGARIILMQFFEPDFDRGSSRADDGLVCMKRNLWFVAPARRDDALECHSFRSLDRPSTSPTDYSISGTIPSDGWAFGLIDWQARQFAS